MDPRSRTRPWVILRALVSPPPLPDLPINEALPALAQALESRRGVLLEAPPGAGKSTIVPLFLLASPWLEGQKILMLEPRRIAARAVAGRMAHLLGETVGRSVGFRTRLETRVSRETRIEVVTEGILTRMLQEDSGLGGIGCVIFDEFHERSLNADLGLALCIESQQNLREELRLVVMSATLDLQPIAKLLGDAPVVAARGRSFEVATQYIARRAEIYLEQQVAQVVRTALREHDGDILCFLPGAAEIRRVQRALEEPGLDRHVRVLPLYGELDGAAQDAALSPAPTGQRKIVLATSIAETSLTIEGIRVVVDSGLRRYAEIEFRPLLPPLVRGHSRLARAADCSGDPARRSRPTGLGTQLLGGRGRREPFLARSAACRAAGAGTRFVTAARSHRFRRARHTAWKSAGEARTPSAAGSHARQGTRARRTASGVRPRRHLERARYLARGRRRARRGSAPACRRATRRCAGSAAGNHGG